MTKTGIVGGTFDVLHDGHHALLLTAFQNGDRVIIGITADELANKSRSRTVTPLSERTETLRDACQTYANVFQATFEVNTITDPYGPAVENDEADLLVISPEQKTHERAAQLNAERTKRGKNRLQIIEAPLVTDETGAKISATRINSGQIDTHGNLTSDA